LLIVAGLHGTAQGVDIIRWFDFEIQMQRLPQPGGSQTLERGTLLVAIDPEDRSVPDDRKFYQSVVVCDSVDVKFDDTGLSKPFKVHGFCFDARVPIPPARVAWEVAGLVEISIREKCDIENQVQVRRPRGVPLDWKRLDQPCEDDRGPCHKRFDSFLKSEYHKDFEWLHDHKLCVIGPTKSSEASYVYELWCDERNIRP
jgi:hypothetical protein